MRDDRVDAYMLTHACRRPPLATEAGGDDASLSGRRSSIVVLRKGQRDDDNRIRAFSVSNAHLATRISAVCGFVASDVALRSKQVPLQSNIVALII